MTAIHTQCKAAYEVEGMTTQQIAEQMELDEISVKATLMQCSSLYRKACGAESLEVDDLNFSDDELRQVNRVIFEAAISAEHSDGTPDWRTRLNAATYVRDDKKGRKEAKSAVQNTTFNILSFNEQIKQAKALKNALVQKVIPA